MKLDVPSFLQAVDRNEGLRLYLEKRSPDAMRMVKTFRKRMGDDCNYVRAAVKAIWYQEVTRGSGDIEPHLRSAGYAA